MIEKGILTKDIINPETSTKLVDTDEFADAVIENLDNKPEQLQ